ncbi:winged helix-turn-helix domain-containing protein [Kitasatospora sp. NPDC092039]|uniref:winged helix-turn-helix domain-containing protein n=1 Tax=Kitasatospora sp. NPDC092039 TaxID=3364086 RepID=UPI0037F6C849
MSSSSTATLTPPTATPHLRAVRSLPPVSSVPAAVPVGPGTSGVAGPSVPPASVSDRWPGATTRPPHAGSGHVGPVPVGPARPAAVPAPAVVQPGAAAPQVPQALLAALPEGAAVVATLPQGVLPQALLAQYGTQFGGVNGTPVVGYLVLVPAENPAAASAGLPGVPVGAGPVGAAGAHAAPGVQPVVDGPAAQTAAGARPVRPAARGIAVDTERRNAYVDGRLLDLTYLEFELLAHLTEHPQRVHTRDHLVSAVWGYGHVGDGRTVDVHVARLRRKLGAAYRDTIVTVRRVGYKYTPATV